jgi:hypothetical protein
MGRNGVRCDSSCIRFRVSCCGSIFCHVDGFLDASWIVGPDIGYILCFVEVDGVCCSCGSVVLPLIR